MDAEIDRFRQQRLRTFYPKTDTSLDDASLKAPTTSPADTSTIASLCRQVFGVEPLSLAPIDPPGTFHHLTRVGLADGRRVIVRVNARYREQADLALGVNAWAMARLGEHGLPSLAVHNVDISRRDVPFEYEILDEAPGCELTEYNADTVRLPLLLGRLGSLLARIHRIEVPGFGWVDIDPRAADPTAQPGQGLFDSWRDYLTTNLDAHVDRCRQIEVIDRFEARRILTILTTGFDSLEKSPSVLLHGDLSSRNIFTDGASITALIDWEDCLAGDPVFDLAFWATFQPEDRYPHLLGAYAAETALPADFDRRFWLYFLRISLSKTVQRHRFGYPDRVPGRPPASQRIHRSLARLEAILEHGSTAPIVAT